GVATARSVAGAARADAPPPSRSRPSAPWAWPPWAPLPRKLRPAPSRSRQDRRQEVTNDGHIANRADGQGEGHQGFARQAHRAAHFAIIRLVAGSWHTPHS